MSAVNPRRLWALCRKESYQIVRDPSSILVAFILPVILLFVMGYAINLDADHMRIGLLREDQGPAAVRLEQTLRASRFFEVHSGPTREALVSRLAQGEIRGIVFIRSDYTSKLKQGHGNAAVQVVTDGAEPNTASFIAAYMQGAFDTWQQGQAADLGGHPAAAVDLRLRSWFNPSNVSRNFLVPGSIAVVMTIIGALLTSLVVAREWERGTMEALLATPVTKAELLASKILPYYLLGMLAMFICLMVSVFIMGIPFRGSLAALFGISTLFLGSALGMGLFLSTVLRSQFNAALAALTSAFLPALMLSGFVFEIDSMPKVLQFITRIIPGRYFASSLQTLFQAGTVDALLWVNALGLGLPMLFWLGLTARKTRRSLD
jgi:ABC-2 type transport system permease protein